MPWNARYTCVCVCRAWVSVLVYLSICVCIYRHANSMPLKVRYIYVCVWLNKSCVPWMSHDYHEWGMTHMNESWLMNEAWLTWMIHDSYEWGMTHMNEAWLIWMRHDSYEWSMTHMHSMLLNARSIHIYIYIFVHGTGSVFVYVSICMCIHRCANSMPLNARWGGGIGRGQEGGMRGGGKGGGLSRLGCAVCECVSTHQSLCISKEKRTKWRGIAAQRRGNSPSAKDSSLSHLDRFPFCAARRHGHVSVLSQSESGWGNGWGNDKEVMSLDSYFRTMIFLFLPFSSTTLARQCLVTI